MKVAVRASGMNDEGLADLVKLRAETALGRFSGRITVVTVRLQDLNGPKGGVDKRCSIEVKGTFGQRMVESRDLTFKVAIDRAFAAMQRSIVRAIQRDLFEQRAAHGIRLAPKVSEPVTTTSRTP